MKITKVMRYQIIKPIDDDWNTLGEVLRTIQRETRTALNKTIQLAWEWQGFSSSYKEIHGTYPMPRDILEKKKGGNVGSIDHFAYDNLKDECRHIYTTNLVQTIKRAADRWKTDVKDILRGDKSIPTFKKDCPLDIVPQAFSLIKEESNYILQASLIGKTYMQKLERRNGSFSLLLKVGDKTQQTILDRILLGEYKVGVSQLIHKGKWFVNITYSFEKEFDKLDPDNIMGIDMGIVYPVYMAFNNSLHRYKIEGGEIDHFRRQVERRKKQLLSQGKYAGNGRRGHGIKTRVKPVEVTAEKVANFRDTCNHKYSRYVVAMAVKHQCGKIQMEDLTGITDRKNTFLKNWSYYDLQQKIEYKARESGIMVQYIKPSYTSQRCSRCGHIEKENRKNQSEFSCLNCGFQTLADYNAARNIATKDIEKIIECAIR
ncbi:transposase [Brevibacillus centrosporus]|uniref:RNA-guided endonuclease TnpB family protein n=1 Tax=Brevibacillus centrosporus TaxID=54910 RepID=UPI003D2401F4